MAKINIFALGGLDENGKNSYVIEIDDSIFLVNAGTKVPISSTNGVDTLIPDFSYLEKNKNRIKGVFITDGKNESFSALPWLLMKIKGLKIYCSPFTKFLILDRISKYKIGHEEYEVISITSEKITFKETEVKSIYLAGSIAGVYGYNFETEDGAILILLNFIVGSLNIYGTTNLEKIKNSVESPKGIHTLLIDSGRANYRGKAIDKIDVTPLIESIFYKTENDSRIIIGAIDEEMALLQEVLDLALKYERPVAVYGRTYGQLVDLIRKIKYEGNFLQMPEFIDYKNVQDHKNAVILVTSTNERIYQRFLRITEDNDVYLKLNDSDKVIMIAPPINGLEVLHALTLDEIARITPHVVDITENEYYRIRPAREDIFMTVKELKPQYFIPLQGLYRYLVVSSEIAALAGVNRSNTIVLQNGKIASFIDGKLFSQKGTIKQVGEVIIDGFGIGDISPEVIKEREALARDGVITINSLIDYKTKKLQGELQIASSGIISKENKNQIHEIITSITYQAFLENEKINLKDVQEKIKKQVRKKMFKLYDKEPIVVTVFYEI
ncbi:ribonuclease J [Mesomycoplasma lagogenitalium]|uniref:Ribonuclease J n=1 Tax=Mesomycoplasma lagogenitalium TaxID=171286 RepID=A0ABY8LW78_9BACT|nr:ribonuclease J [Mesomycoplasma lagogenitalium]WGI36676.1 ribonuclease J [Mesomycoplasma lagogenitalium]